MTGYNKTDNTYKRWQHIPVRFCTNLRDLVNKNFSVLQNIPGGVLSNKTHYYRRFNTIDTNPGCRYPTKYFIPAVSLRNEMKTTGFGLAILELLSLSSVIEEVTTDSATEWILCAG